MKRIITIGAVFVLAAGLMCFYLIPRQSRTLKIGFNIPLSGDLSALGESTRDAAELIAEQLRKEGGLAVGGKKYDIEFIYADNKTDPNGAVAASVNLVVENDVLGVIGPIASSMAIPAGEICDINSTPMISPSSTNPKTTAFRPYVFRGCFLDPFQGPITANFVTEEMHATTAAVLYAEDSAYSKGLAKYFKDAFEQLHGADAIVAAETFKTGETDFKPQLEQIMASGANVLFVPQYHNEVSQIVNQGRTMGFNKPMMGSDSWGSSELMNMCGDACKGLNYITHYTAVGAQGASLTFVNQFKKRYNQIPDDVAALAWDSVNLMLQAIVNTGGISNNLLEIRDAIKDELARIQDFYGITGKMSFTPEGDPVKCATVVKINNAGEPAFYKSVCP